MRSEWEVWQIETQLPHLCSECHEELCYVGVKRADGLGMTAVMCPKCNDALPVLPLEASR